MLTSNPTQVAGLFSRLVWLSLQIEDAHVYTSKKGRQYKKVVAQCEFSCRLPAVGKLACSHFYSDEYFNHDRYACAEHKYVNKIACDMAGRKGCKASFLPLEDHEQGVDWDDEVVLELVERAFITPHGQFGYLVDGSVLPDEYGGQFDADAFIRVALYVQSNYPALFHVIDVPDFRPLLIKENAGYVRPVFELKDVAEIPAVAAEKRCSEDTDVVVPQTVAAEKRCSEGKRRHVRSSRQGKHVKKSKWGYCYLSLVPRSKRDQFPDLGPAPPIGAVLDALLELDILPRHHRIEFVYSRGVHGAHVKPERDWKFAKQAEWLNRFDRSRPLGAEEFPENYCPEHFAAGEVNDAMVEVCQFLTEVMPMDDAGPEMFGIPEQEELPRYVRAPGHCWTALQPTLNKLWVMEMKKKEFECECEEDDPWTHVTAKDIHDNLRLDMAGVRAIKYSFQNDGDLHIEGYRVVWTGDPWPEGFVEGKEFKDMLAKHFTKLVGKPAASPIEKALGTIASPEVRVAVERNLQVSMVDMIDQANRICPYAIPAKNQHYMEELSLPWLPAGPVHSHPVHAATRRHMLLEELPKQIKCDTTFVSMKEEHHQMVVREIDRLHPNHGWTLPLVNPVIDIKDPGRFAGTDTVPISVWHLDRITTPAVHIDESWHYLNPSFLEDLARQNPNIVALTAISIFPMVALELEQSPDPDLYGFTVHRKKGKAPELTYWMEGNTRQTYTQPFDPTMILARRVESEDGKIVWNGGAICKLLNTRLHVYSRFHLSSPSYEIVLENKYIKLPKVFRNQMDLPMIRLEHFVKLADYAKVMVVDKDTNYWGKWRMFMKDEGIHMPWGYFEHIIQVIVECKRLSATKRLQSREITGVMHHCYYETVGKLLKFIEKKTLLPYVKRHAEITSQRSNVLVYPTVSVVSKPRTAEGLYAVSWKLDGDDGRGFWGKFTMWLKSWGYSGLTPSQVMMDIGGSVRFPFTANTWLNQQRYGIVEIRESQARVFRQVYEHDDTPVRSGPAKVELQLTKPAVETETSDGSSYQEPEELPPMEETIGEDMSYWHCETCPTFMDYVQKGGFLDRDYYDAHCAALHTVPQSGDRNRMVDLIKAGFNRRTGADRLPVIQEEGTPSVPMPPPIPGNRPDIPSRLMAKPPEEPPLDLGMYSKKWKDKTPKQLDTERNKPMMVKQEKTLRKPETTWQERQNDWMRRATLLSKERSRTIDASGGLLWDRLYPATVDNRLSTIPYRDVAMYPGPKYPDNDCLLEALASISGLTPPDVLFRMQRAYKRSALQNEDVLEEALIWPFALHCGVRIVVEDGRHERHYGLKRGSMQGRIVLKDGHYEGIQAFKVPLLIREYREVPTLPQNPTYTRMVAWDACKFTDWVPEQTRADKLIRAILNNEVGLINQPVNLEALRGWSNTIDAGYRGPPKQIAIVMGDPGCRKSTQPQKAMRERKNFGEWGFIAPTNQIAQDYRDKLDATTVNNKGKKMNGDMVLTWESALAKYAGAQLMIADENKYPPGYLAMFHILNPTAKAQLFLGDAWQAAWHSPRPTALNDEVSELEFYAPRAKGFIVGTWRFAGLSAAFWRMPSYSNKVGAWAFTRSLPTVWTGLKQYYPWLNDATLLDMWEERQEYTAASFQAQFAEELRGSEARSYSGSIGVTAALAIVHVDEAVLRGTDCRLIYTAMTRSAHILFVINWVHNRTAEYHEERHPVFRKLRYYRENYRLGQRLEFNPEHSVSIREITFPFPEEWDIWMAGPIEKCTNLADIVQWWPLSSWEKFIDPDAKRGGASPLSRSDPIYADAPEFLPFITETPAFDPEEPVIEEAGPEEALPATSIPQAHREGFVEFHQSQVRERYDADIFVKGELTNQFPDTPRLRFDSAYQLLKLVEAEPGFSKRQKFKRVLDRLSKIEGTEEDPRYSHDPVLLWAAMQRADDHASWLLAKKQRIRFSTPEANMLNLVQQTKFGDECWESFRKYMNWSVPVPWNEERYHQAIDRFQERRNDRPESLKKGSLNRASPDFNIIITLKQQLKLKDDEWKPAKPPQPVWIHPDAQLFTEGPAGLLLLDLLLEHKPPWWHFHARESYETFATWAQEYMAHEPMHEMNDQVGQDQSTQGWAVRVMEQMMLWFNFPSEIIREFIHNKIFKTLDGKTFVAIMTDSGEVWTFLINTISSTARECFMYNIPPGHPQANGGDDTWRKPMPGLNPAYEPFRAMDPVEDKRFVSNKASFTAYSFKNGILYRNPILLLKRFLVRIAAGKGEEAVLGYGEAFRRNYVLREKLIDAMNEEELEAHNILTRIFMNLKKEGLKTKLNWQTEFAFEFEPLPQITKTDFETLLKTQVVAPIFSMAQSIEPLFRERMQPMLSAAYTAEF